MKRVITTAVAAIFCLVAFTAQAQPGNGLDKEAMKEKITSLKTAFITEKLDLSSEEAQVFWPVYNEFTEAMEAYHPERGEKPDLEAMTDAEADQFMNERFDMEQAKLNVKKQYHAKFKQVLPVKKVAMLYGAEKEFKKEMLHKLKGKQNAPPPGE